MDNPLTIGVILASVRAGRRGAGFANWIHGLLAERSGVAVELLDLKDYPLPAYQFEVMTSAIEKNYPEGPARSWSAKIHSLDAFVIVTPEYNRGYPGQLKNALDHVHTGWWYKPVGFVSYGGTGSGARAVQQLHNVAIEVRMMPVRTEVNIRLIGLSADAAGHPADPIYMRFATGMIDQLLWWARVAKEGRERHAPPA